MEKSNVEQVIEMRRQEFVDDESERYKKHMARLMAKRAINIDEMWAKHI